MNIDKRIDDARSEAEANQRASDNCTIDAARLRSKADRIEGGKIALQIVEARLLKSDVLDPNIVSKIIEAAKDDIMLREA